MHKDKHKIRTNRSWLTKNWNWLRLHSYIAVWIPEHETPEPPSAERGMYVTRILKFAVGQREVADSLKRVRLISRNLPFIQITQFKRNNNTIKKKILYNEFRLLVSEWSRTADFPTGKIIISVRKRVNSCDGHSTIDF